MGEFLLTGPNALALIQKVTSNDASTLTGQHNVLA
jgi:aminomethyltransferase